MEVVGPLVVVGGSGLVVGGALVVVGPLVVVGGGGLVVTGFFVVVVGGGLVVLGGSVFLTFPLLVGSYGLSLDLGSSLTLGNSDPKGS